MDRSPRRGCACGHAERPRTAALGQPRVSRPPSSPASLPINQSLRDRRREKPVLSCTFCRSRKVRCDRQLPCQTCTSKGIALSCTYLSPSAPPRRANVSVGDRIQQLESLVRSLADGQDTQNHQVQVQTPRSTDSTSQPPAVPTPVQLGNTESAATSPQAAAVHGTMHVHNHGTPNYVGSVHWAAVLDSIAELRDHYEEEEEARMFAASSSPASSSPDPGESHTVPPVPHIQSGLRLLYEPVHVTKSDIVASIPPRPTTDRLVAGFFQAPGVRPDILHSGRFLREYESFWKNPSETPIIWIGLLFSILCLAAQYVEVVEDGNTSGMPLPEASDRVLLFRERTVQCLVLGNYTRAGDYVLETLIYYLYYEMFPLRNHDADMGLWVVLGMIVQLAIGRGYHRDPDHFGSGRGSASRNGAKSPLNKFTPFVSEMRRRVWSVIVQLDLRIASQMGLPRLLRWQQCDAAEPRNLLDEDLLEDATTLPSARPETQTTSILYGITKGRMDHVGGLVCDFVNDVAGSSGSGPAAHTYAQVMDLDRQLRDAEAALPPVFRWQPLRQSFMVQAPTLMHRVLLQLALQRWIIWLHRGYLTPLAGDAGQGAKEHDYAYSRTTCVQAALRLLEYQLMIDEETRTRDGLLYSVRWMFVSSRLQAVFLLGMSILCYHLQLQRRGAEPEPEQERRAPGGEDTAPSLSYIRNMLASAYRLWQRSDFATAEMRHAASRLGRLMRLGDDNERVHNAVSASCPTLVATDSDAAPASMTAFQNDETLDHMTWDAYQECMADYPAIAAEFGISGMATDAGRVSSADLSMSTFFMTDTSIPEDWMNIEGDGNGDST